MARSTTYCQACGEIIEPGTQAVKVQTGTFGYTAHPRARVRGGSPIDYFHASCPVAIRCDPENMEGDEE